MTLGGSAEAPRSLVEALAHVLPKNVHFAAHHLSTPPTPTDPLCCAPAYPVNDSTKDDVRARKPLKTYCERQFLGISIHVPGAEQRVLILALEIYIYTTTHTSIIFVSKADSTGYLGLLKLPEGTPSPIREVTTAFLSYLVAHRRRIGIQCVINLFARAQSQYLFPGSVKNNGKHVLDDRGLVKWWCRVLNPLLEETSSPEHQRGDRARNSHGTIRGYLVIPGLDEYETRAFLPRSPSAASRWTLGHPLNRISPYTSNSAIYGANIPPRCLIPVYADDPKARFIQELEETTSEKQKLVGGWKFPKTLDQFWEMMAFRQECSSGRLTGFVWVVLEPSSDQEAQRDGITASRSAAAFIQTPQSSFTESSGFAQAISPTPEATLPGRHSVTPTATPKKVRIKPESKTRPALKGRIIPRQPTIKSQQRSHFPAQTETTHYSWPEQGRGSVVLDESGYKRAVELLLHLEFDTLAHAITSSTRWVNEVNVGREWGIEIVGQREAPAAAAATSGVSRGIGVNDLSGTIKRKKPTAEAVQEGGPAVTTLGAGLVRKKAKTDPTAEREGEVASPSVNILTASLVRKKSKPPAEAIE